MSIQYQKTVDPGGPEKEKKAEERPHPAGTEEDCRCKEASKMSPRELFTLMMHDLAFWKKAKKG